MADADSCCVNGFQDAVLKKEFQKNPYPREDAMKELSTRLDLTLTQVENWFANYRRKTKSVKSTRNRFTGFQIEVLKREFQKHEKPTGERIEELSRNLKLTPIQIQRWFYSYRSKIKALQRKAQTEANNINSLHQRLKSNNVFIGTRDEVEPSPGPSQSIYRPLNRLSPYSMLNQNGQNQQPSIRLAQGPPQRNVPNNFENRPDLLIASRSILPSYDSLNIESTSHMLAAEFLKIERTRPPPPYTAPMHVQAFAPFSTNTVRCNCGNHHSPASNGSPVSSNRTNSDSDISVGTEPVPVSKVNNAINDQVSSPATFLDGTTDLGNLVNSEVHAANQIDGKTSSNPSNTSSAVSSNWDNQQPSVSNGMSVDNEVRGEMADTNRTGQQTASNLALNDSLVSWMAAFNRTSQ